MKKGKEKKEIEEENLANFGNVPYISEVKNNARNNWMNNMKWNPFIYKDNKDEAQVPFLLNWCSSTLNVELAFALQRHS